jgi:hypothetical protein
MPIEDHLLGTELSMTQKAQEERRRYFKRSLMQYGFTEEQAELLVQSLDEFVEEEKGLAEEAKESLYKG